MYFNVKALHLKSAVDSFNEVRNLLGARITRWTDDFIKFIQMVEIIVAKDNSTVATLLEVFAYAVRPHLVEQILQFQHLHK